MNDGNLNFVRVMRALIESQNSGRRKIYWVAAAVVLLFIVLFVIGGNYGILNILKLREERKALQTELKSLEQERDSLKLGIAKLKYDKHEIERVAREKYGMALPGEKVIKFVDPKDTSRHP